MPSSPKPGPTFRHSVAFSRQRTIGMHAWKPLLPQLKLQQGQISRQTTLRQMTFSRFNPLWTVFKKLYRMDRLGEALV